MSIVLNGRPVATPGLETVSWFDDPKVPQATDSSPRRTWIRAIVLHTVHGKRGIVKPGAKSSTRAESYARYQANTPRSVSWDYTLDTDGTVIVSGDPVRRFTWHATSWNAYSVGVELVQDEDGSLYADQLSALVRLCDILTAELGIQRQTAVTADGKPDGRVIPRTDEKGVRQGRDMVGVFGHRNNTESRGLGDPTDHPFDALLAAGYEGFDMRIGTDLAAWKERQADLGYTAASCDGIPGALTRQALFQAGRPHGLWVVRP